MAEATISEEQQAIAARKRAQRLGQARADLVDLPRLMEELSRCQTERPPGEGGPSGKPGSRPPLRMDVLHLTDTHRKPGWEGDDPRLTNLTERHGVAPLLETWTRVLTEEMPTYPELAEHATVRTEAATLVEHWAWISEQQWAEELADDVIRVVGWVKVALSIRPEYRPRCRYCRSAVRPVDQEHRASTWETCAYGLCAGCGATFAPGPELLALGQVQPPIPLREAAEMTGVPLRTLQRWVADGAVQPALDSKGRRRGRKFDLAEIRAVSNRIYGRVAG